MYIQNYAITKSNVSVRTAIAASAIPPLNPQISANTARQKICFTNGSSTLKFYIAFGTNEGSITDYTLILNPGDYFEDTTSIDAVSAVSNGTSLTDILYVTEMS